MRLVSFMHKRSANITKHSFMYVLYFELHITQNFSFSFRVELALADNRDAAIKGEFLSVSLYATCSPCDMAPRGLSKYTHIADGSMDLITVKNTERKEFMRFIKRTGNSKNQVDNSVFHWW